MLRVYYCRLNLDDPEPSGMILSAYRTEKLAAQKAALVRKQSLYSELLLRFALKDSGFAPEASLEITAGSTASHVWQARRSALISPILPRHCCAHFQTGKSAQTFRKRRGRRMR